MNIYLISQTINRGWDIYDSAVVVAESADDAKKIHPAGIEGGDIETPIAAQNGSWYDWCAQKDVKVKEIGVIFEGMERGVVCASFNAATSIAHLGG